MSVVQFRPWPPLPRAGNRFGPNGLAFIAGVSSPGLDRALTKPGHFARFSGETVKLTIEPAFEGLRKLTGVLIGLDGDHIAIDVDGVVNKIPYAHIARARVVPQY